MNARDATGLQEYATATGVKSYIFEMEPDNAGRYALIVVLGGCKRELIIGTDEARTRIDEVQKAREWMEGTNG